MTISRFLIKGGSDITQWAVNNKALPTSQSQIKTWSSRSAMLIPKRIASGCGTDTATLVLGGQDGSGTFDVVEYYDGTSWSLGPRFTFFSEFSAAACGVSTDALLFGKGTAQRYDGTTWVFTGNMLSSKKLLSGSGVATSALAAGGLSLTTFSAATTEKYDGTTWVGMSDIIAVRYLASMSGTSRRVLLGGWDSGDRYASNSEAYTGISWYTLGATIMLKADFASVGEMNSCLSFGGYTVYDYLESASNSTEFFNGATFSIASPSLSFRYALSGSGSSSSAISASGELAIVPGVFNGSNIYNFSALTEQYGSTIVSISTIGTGWVSKSPMSQARSSCGQSGTNHSFLIISGDVEPYSTTNAVPNTEWFNGWVWSTHLGPITTRYKPASCGGSSYSTFLLGGYDEFDNNINTTEIFNGSSWVSSELYPLYLSGGTQVGSALLNLTLGGYDNMAGSSVNNTFEFNGVSFASKTHMPVNTYRHSSVGDPKDCFTVGGCSNTSVNFTTSYSFNGFSFTKGPDISSASSRGSAGGSSDSTTYVLGENAGLLTTECLTELYNGVSWSAGEPSLSKAHRCSSSTDSSLVLSGGASGHIAIDTTCYYNNNVVSDQTLRIEGVVDVIDAFLSSTVVLNCVIRGLIPNTSYTITSVDCLVDSYSSMPEASKTLVSNSLGRINLEIIVPTSPLYSTTVYPSIEIQSLSFVKQFSVRTRDNLPVWTAVASLLTSRSRLTSAGVVTSSISFGGYNGGYRNNTEMYNGTGWTNVAGMLVARYALGGSGESTNALSFGGSGSSSYYANTENFNGSAWAARSAMLNTRRWLTGCGISTSTLAYGASSSGKGQINELYDGSTWATRANLIIPKGYLAGTGISTAALSIGGYYSYSGPGYLNTTELFDGTSWSTLGNILTTRDELAASGISTSALCFGGEWPAYANTEKFNGSTWANSTNMLQARYDLAGCGTSSDTLSIGGYSGAYLGTVEHLSFL